MPKSFPGHFAATNPPPGFGKGKHIGQFGFAGEGLNLLHIEKTMRQEQQDVKREHNRQDGAQVTGFAVTKNTGQENGRAQNRMTVLSISCSLRLISRM